MYDSNTNAGLGWAAGVEDGSIQPKYHVPKKFRNKMMSLGQLVGKLKGTKFDLQGQGQDSGGRFMPKHPGQPGNPSPAAMAAVQSWAHPMNQAGAPGAMFQEGTPGYKRLMGALARGSANRRNIFDETPASNVQSRSQMFRDRLAEMFGEDQMNPFQAWVQRIQGMDHLSDEQKAHLTQRMQQILAMLQDRANQDTPFGQQRPFTPSPLPWQRPQPPQPLPWQ